uniref:Uncharacterized protein n=1 Tax=Romanomermis culicivorax TaxID=13658 RepID=A0A915IVI4_ROMCU
MNNCHQNNFPLGMMTSARGPDYQNVPQQCSLISTRGANNQNGFLQGAMTSTRDGNDQNAFPRGTMTSVRAVTIDMLFQEAL